MDRLIEFFIRNPVLLVVAVVWIAGVVGNIVKAGKRAREAAVRRQDAQPAPVPSAPSRQPVAVEPPPLGQARPMGQRDAEAVAREMRRILGLEPAAGDRSQAADEGRAEPTAGDRFERTEAPPARPTAAPPPRRPPIAPRPPAVPQRARRDVAMPERAPTPVEPSTNRRRLEVHVDPHVGESIGKRARVGSGKVGDHALGDLGGRTQSGRSKESRGARYELDDLKRAFVLSEILGPPLASRPERRDP